MKSIERRFQQWEDKRPNVGSLLNYQKAVTGLRCSRDRLSRYLTKLVPADDYERKERKAILGHLYALSWGLKRTDSGGNSPEKGVGNQNNDEGTV